MKKILTSIFIFLLLGIFIFALFSIFSKKEDSKKSLTYHEKISFTHNGEKIDDILNKSNYDKIGINPEKYESFGDFLEEFKTYSGVFIDPINENFTIGVKKDNGNILYIPFKFVQNKELFDNKDYKNLAILDIYKSYKDGMIYGGINSKYGSKVIFENENYHPENEELSKIFNREVNVFKYIDSLKKSEILGKDKQELLGYLYDFVGDYDNAKNTRDKNCKEYNICEKDFTNLTVTGKILDSNNNPIPGAKIQLLNDISISTLSNKDGEYELKFNFSSLSHLRFKTSILGYSDGFSNYSLNQKFNYPKIIEVNFVLHKYHDKVAINSQNSGEFEKGRYYLIETEGSKYFIPKDGLYYFDGKKYTKNDFEVYIYQFTKWSNMDNLLENDTFEPVFGYVGNIMKTFGMPYIQFFDKESKQELFIKSSNPMILQNQVYHMQELYDNYDKIYEPITKEDMDVLYKYSQENEGYPIDFDYLTKNNFLRWPARWSLDRKTGVWSNVGQRLLDTNGLVELPFYSIKDN